MRKSTVFLVSFFTITLIYYVYRSISKSDDFVHIILYHGSSLLAVVARITTLKIYGKGSKFLSLLYLILGIVMWSLGDLIWTYDNLYFGKITYPSIADLFYLGAYPVILYSLLREFKDNRINWKEMHRGLLYVLILICILFTSFFSYFSIFQSYSPTVSLSQNLVTISYGIGDLFLVIASLVIAALAWEYRGGKVSKAWILLFFGFFATLIADMMYAVFTAEYDANASVMSAVINYFYIGGYLLIAGAFFSLKDLITSIQSKVLDPK